MFCFIRFLIDIKSPLTPELYVKIYIEMSRQALLYTAISALRPWKREQTGHSYRQYTVRPIIIAAVLI